MKVLARKGSLTAVQDVYGRVWLCHRKKYKHDNRRRKKGRVVHRPIICMSKFKLKTFLSNINAWSDHLDREERKQGVAKIISSLQRPMSEVLAAVCEKQKKDAEELYKTLGWIWEKKI